MNLPVSEKLLAASGYLLPHQQRVVAERKELEERLAKLTDFMASPVFAGVAPEEKVLLRRQAAAMSAYSEVLLKRIEGFKSGPPDERMVVWRQDAAPSDADPLGQGVEDVAIPEGRFRGIEVRPLQSGLPQKVQVMTRAELPPGIRLL